MKNIKNEIKFSYYNSKTQEKTRNRIIELQNDRFKIPSLIWLIRIIYNYDICTHGLMLDQHMSKLLISPLIQKNPILF